MLRIVCRVLLIMCVPMVVHALDLLEPYNKGFSDVELYYSNNNGNEHNVTPVFAYGFSDYLNPMLSPSMNAGPDGSSYSLGLYNLMTVYQGIIDIDLLPGIMMSPDANVLSLGLELSKSFGIVTPYIQASVSDGSQAASVGTMVEVVEGSEVFVQATRAMSDEDVTGGAIGFNQRLSDSLELITEVGHLSTWNSSLGVIWTFDPLF